MRYFVIHTFLKIVIGPRKWFIVWNPNILAGRLCAYRNVHKDFILFPFGISRIMQSAESITKWPKQLKTLDFNKKRKYTQTNLHQDFFLSFSSNKPSLLTPRPETASYIAFLKKWHNSFHFMKMLCTPFSYIFLSRLLIFVQFTLHLYIYFVI